MLITVSYGGVNAHYCPLIGQTLTVNVGVGRVAHSGPTSSYPAVHGQRFASCIELLLPVPVHAQLTSTNWANGVMDPSRVEFYGMQQSMNALESARMVSLVFEKKFIRLLMIARDIETLIKSSRVEILRKATGSAFK